MTLPLGDCADAELAARAAAGEADAYRVLFGRHVEHVTAICRQRLRACDIDDAVQETFARALANLHQLRTAANFGPWVRTIAVRVCADHHRAGARSLPSPPEELDLTDSQPQPDEVVLAAEYSASVRQTLAALGPRDARALWLRHVTDAPVAAVASELGLTPGSTRVLLTRARHRLRAATSTLPALLPLSWRNWIREHLPSATPALEVFVAVVAVGLAVNVAGAPPATSRPEPSNEQRVVSLRGPHGAGDVAQGSAADAKTRTASDAAPDTPRRPRAAARPAAEQPRRSVKIADTVTVQDEYPSDDEAESLADVAVFNDGEEVETRLYGTAPKAAKQTRRALPRVPDEGVEVGGVRVGKGGDEDGKKGR